MRTNVLCLLCVLLVSARSGADATQLPVVDGGLHWVQKCANQGITFRAATDGWLRSACGDLYRSDDQGRTWRELPADAPPVSLFRRSPTPGSVGPISFVTWLSESVGLIGGLAAHIARTTDGGKTWTEVRVPTQDGIWNEAHVENRVWLCDGRGGLIRSDDGGLSWGRFSAIGDSFGCFDLSFADRDHGWASVPDHQSIRMDDGLLRYYTDGKLAESTAVLGRGQGEKERLLGTLRTKRGPQWGWSERHVFHSYDGTTWSVVSDAPDPPLETMVLVNESTALARSRAGKLFRSDRWF